MGNCPGLPRPGSRLTSEHTSQGAVDAAHGGRQKKCAGATQLTVAMRLLQRIWQWRTSFSFLGNHQQLPQWCQAMHSVTRSPQLACRAEHTNSREHKKDPSSAKIHTDPSCAKGNKVYDTHGRGKHILFLQIPPTAARKAGGGEGVLKDTPKEPNTPKISCPGLAHPEAE